ncbi:MAG TPA: alpha/beta hydrolase [Crenalkalicoccus sp.]|nr:alpha/beta hydrolase [Crenalkalicoccus sp.]
MSYHPLPAFWVGATPAARDAAYDNTRAVPDSAALIEARNQAAAAFRPAHAGHLDLAYGEGERCKWDLFPGSEPGAPCLVFIHGGYWQRNRREDFCAFMAGALAKGWSAALPGYTLAPEAPLSRIVAEIRQALDWLAAQGPRHGIAGKLVLSGWSAGGHLVGMAMDHPAVTAGLAISGIFELAPIRDTQLNDALNLTEQEIATLSPMRLPAVRKPVAIAYGSAELPELRRQSREWHAQRALAHAPGPLIPVSGADHFRVLEALAQPEGELLRAAADLLRFG